MILHAASALIAEKGSAEVTLQDILDATGLGTRSFYRHFETKDDLLRVLYRTEVEALAERLEACTAAAPTPRAAVEAWLEEFVEHMYRPRTSERQALFSTGLARTGAPDEASLEWARQRLAVPLVAALEAGRRDGSLPAARPEQDAHAIRAVAMEVTRWRESDARRTPRQDVSYLLTFCLPALGGRHDDS